MSRNKCKEVKDINDGGNFKSLTKQTKKDTTRWKDLLCSQIGRMNIAKN